MDALTKRVLSVADAKRRAADAHSAARVMAEHCDARIAKKETAIAALLNSLSVALDIIGAVRGLPDNRKPCSDLCGNSWCNEFGCISDKSREARAAIKLAKART